ncbi:PTS sugar transporter subunit IIA [Stakelama marina]|uniref:PTS sugar transporter subunit IIA n=1 Tax=Stakelama marina TaxID=2826939 RepID=A0A8T4IEA5_9SPHN|nr:PTS sugar transporter subunit IIA [Stakelama marina]MBR0552977.1 PTS sugar transporter subunit IIA [Stakelama marina]
MTDFSDLITPETVFSEVCVANRKALFHKLGQLAAEQWGLDARAITEALTEREKLVSTGCGAGIAIPHARPKELDRIVGAVLHLEAPIDFESVDDLPVDLVFLLLSPADAGADHLKALARIARALRDRAFADKLRGAGSRDALYAMLADLETCEAV